MSSRRNANYEIMDKLLGESQQGRGDVVWIDDPRSPNGGYYVQVSDRQTLTETFKTVDDIEKYLRS